MIRIHLLCRSLYPVIVNIVCLEIKPFLSYNKEMHYCFSEINLERMNDMKVLLLNGSPRKAGCTFTALEEIASVLNANGIETEIFQAGNPETENVKAAAAKLKEADGLVVGSPVYWASPSGQIIEFMDKLCSMAGKDMLHKPAAAVASARRAGTTATLDVLQKYFSYHEMPLVSANYWNMVHGNTPEEVRQDEEGLQIMRTLGQNMAWLLKCLEAGRRAGIETPVTEEKIKTNFIR